MNLKKELIKAGFKDQPTQFTVNTGTGDDVDFELHHDLPKGGIRLQKLTAFNEVEITIYSDSGYELLLGMAEDVEEDDE